MNNIKEILEKQAKRLNYINSINLIGSCAYDTNAEDKQKEIDYYVVVEKLTPCVMLEITDLFGSLRKLYPNIYIELRRGPFKNKSAKQIHLILDDYESIHSTSSITLNDWSLNSMNIYGDSISRLIPKISNQSLKESFIGELTKTISMIKNRKIIYKEWVTKNDNLTLCNKEKDVSSLYDYLILLKYAYTAMKNNWLALNKQKISRSEIVCDIEHDLMRLKKYTLADYHKLEAITKNVLSFNRILVKQVAVF
jgi:hypothetical protein